jgi:ATP-binding cassette subfamily B protein
VDIPPLPFKRDIRLQAVSFAYGADTPAVLHEVNLAVPKGARIGLIGPTGSGKSTLMDLILGLLEPTSGHMSVDGIEIRGERRLRWQRNIAHVPQAIFLADASFMENIAFGVPPDRIDHERVRAAAANAQIAEFIESQSNGYWRHVGERGMRLSGGQRQRIGIARALYRRASVLVFDEATSALDSETEVAVMESISQLGRDLTIVLIAHRLSTLRDCDVIYRLEKGHIASSGTYEATVAPG